MKPKLKLKPFFYVSLFVAIFIIFLLLGLNYKLNSDINQIKKQNEELNEQLNTALSEVQESEKEIKNLESDLSKTTEELGESKEKLEETKKDIKSIKTELSNFEKKIKDSMAWFKNNSNIAFHEEYGDIEDDLVGYCLSYGTRYCKIILSCLPFVNRQRSYIIYRYDEETSLKVDALQTLNQIYKNQGGDCEDISLLAVAELNYMIDYCKKEGVDEPQFFAFVPEFDSYSKYWDYRKSDDEGSSFYYVTKDMNWGYSNAEEYEIPKDYKYYYTVCGVFYEESENYEGLVGVPQLDIYYLQDTAHCVLALTKIPIESLSDIKKALKDSILVEPQTGMKYSQDAPPILDSNLESDVYISHVITEDDLYQFYESDDGQIYWKNYDSFLEDVDEAQTTADNINLE